MKSGLQKDDIILKMDNLNIADKAAYDE